MSPHPTNPVMPHLTVANCKQALEFYADALGAKELYRADADDGKRLLHAAMDVNGAVVMLNDDFPEWTGGATPEKFGGSPVVLHVELKAAKDVDAWHTRAVDAGAISDMKPEDMFWGDRYAKVKDPFGHGWSFGAPAGA